MSKEEALIQIETDYASLPDEHTEIVEIKDLYKTLAAKLVDSLPEGRDRYRALDELKQSKAWAVSAIGPNEEIPPAEPPPEIPGTSSKKSHHAISK